MAQPPAQAASDGGSGWLSGALSYLSSSASSVSSDRTTEGQPTSHTGSSSAQRAAYRAASPTRYVPGHFAEDQPIGAPPPAAADASRSRRSAARLADLTEDLRISALPPAAADASRSRRSAARSNQVHYPRGHAAATVNSSATASTTSGRTRTTSEDLPAASYSSETRASSSSVSHGTSVDLATSSDTLSTASWSSLPTTTTTTSSRGSRVRTAGGSTTTRSAPSISTLSSMTSSGSSSGETLSFSLSPATPTAPPTSSAPATGAPAAAAAAATVEPGAVAIDMAELRARQRREVSSILHTSRERLRLRQAVGEHLTAAELRVVIINFDNRETRDQLAELASIDDYEQISSAQGVHPWFQRETNVRHAVAHHLRQDIMNAMRLCDRLADTVSFFVQVEPEAMEAGRHLDAAVEPVLFPYLPRGIRCRGGDAELTFQLMVEAFRHGVGAEHVADFTARKESVMTQGSRYRSLPVLKIVNALPARRFVAAPMVVGRHNEAEQQAAQADTLSRFEERRRFQRQWGRLPAVPTFEAAVRDRALLRDAMAVAVKNVVLAVTPSCPALEDWPRIFRDEYGVTARIAAELVHAALTDLLPVNWPM